MEDIYLGLIMIAIAVFGYFIVDRFGHFMDEICSDRKNNTIKKNNTMIILTRDKSLEEITDKIECFCKSHGKRTVILCMDEDSELFNQYIDIIESTEEEKYLE